MSATNTQTASSRTELSSPQAYPAEKARQGEIILKTTWARAVFMTGLFGGIVLAIILVVYFATLG